MTTQNDNTTEDTLEGATGTDTGVEQANPLDMSDEDFLKQQAPDVQPAEKVEKTAAEAKKDGEVGENDEVVVDTAKKTGTETVEGDGGTPATKTGDGAVDKTPETTAKKPGEDGADPEKKVEPTERTDSVDYAAAGKALLAPFKANGREIRVDTVEDARALMQMGANYNKKMAGLKPNLKILKLLENNDLLSEEKLGFLIDVAKKDPAAINKLVKESGINPLDISPDKAGDYRPNTARVDDREVELDTVLDDIKDSTAYTQTLAIAKAWDTDSKKVIGDQPALLKVINNHIESGIYPLISAEVERERTFGRLQGLSDIAAYKQVGDAIQARGGFNHLFQPAATAAGGQGQASEAGKVVEPKPGKVDDESRNDKRRGMGSPKSATQATSTATDFNPLAMSDDEIQRMGTPKFR